MTVQLIMEYSSLGGPLSSPLSIILLAKAWCEVLVGYLLCGIIWEMQLMFPVSLCCRGAVSNPTYACSCYRLPNGIVVVGGVLGGLGLGWSNELN